MVFYANSSYYADIDWAPWSLSNMKPPNILDIICFMPLIVMYAVVELKRSWKILKHGEASLNPALQIRIWLLRLFRGSKVAHDYRTALLTDTDTMKVRGVYSLVGGLILLIGSMILVYFWLQ